MATRFSILAWKIPWTEELVGLQSLASKSQDGLKSDWENLETPLGFLFLLNLFTYVTVPGLSWL